MRLLPLIFLFFTFPVFATSWTDIKSDKRGELIVNFYNSDNFISDASGELSGIEYDLILAFCSYITEQGYAINPRFVKQNSFGELYNYVLNGGEGIGACSFSITEKRLEEVGFTPKYMPDVEVMICSKNLPILNEESEFNTLFSSAIALSVPNTTFEKDLEWLKTVVNSITIEEVGEAKIVRSKIKNENSYYGYIELPTYVKLLKEGTRLRRQYLFKVERSCYGLIYPKESDWEEPLNNFFASKNFHSIMNTIIQKHLGEDVKELITSVGDNQKQGDSKEIELLTKEREFQSDQLTAQQLQIVQHEAQRNYLIGASSTILIVLLLMIYGYRLKKKANQALQEQYDKIESQKSDILAQNKIIEEKNKDITDSINYARRIQEAVLPSTSILTDVFSDAFVLFQPRDIVSGDFFWLARQSDFCFVILADCTGHGVPGAFMSMMGVNFLSQIITDNAITSTGVALSILDKKVREALRNDKHEAVDGMDITMMAYHIPTKTLEFSGGMNSMVLLRDNKITKYKGDRLSIGGSENEEKVFTSHQVQLADNDIIYTFTDGLQDQFGGTRGKKFRQKKLLELLTENCQLTLKEQHTIIENELKTWMIGYEQVDDISVIGFKI